MTGTEVRALRAKYPFWDLDALLGMEDLGLSETIAACHVLYGGSDNRPSPVHDRAACIRKILSFRARFASMPPEARAQIIVEDEEMEKKK